MTTKKQFYVYAHCRPDGEPFYIGKGLLSRAYSWKPRNPHHNNVMMKYGTDNLMIRAWPCASENEAFMCEIAMIAELRALGIKLTNITPGGEGVSGISPSKETLAKRSASLKKTFAERGKVNPPSQREKARINALGNRNCVGRVVSKEVRTKIAESVRGNKSAFGHKKSTEFKTALSARMKGTRHAAGHVVSKAVRDEWSRKRKGKPWSEARRAAYNRSRNCSTI